MARRGSPWALRALLTGAAALTFPLHVAGEHPGAPETSAPFPALLQDGRPAAARTHAAPGAITGRVTGAEGEPLQGATVTLRAASDSALVTGVVTDREGAFALRELPLDTYLLHVGRLGHRSRTSEVITLTAEAPTVDLGEIPLEASPILLDEVEAVVDRPFMMVEADRTVYDARAMPVASAGSAVDVLRAVPELEVDVNSNVRLRGNQPVAIHLNGRPMPLRGEDLARFLEQLPGDQIARIEVMPNPSARHDPEGMGGIVNIVLRDDAELGLSGSLSVTASTRNHQRLSGRFNLQRGPFTLFSGGGVGVFRDDVSTTLFRRNLVADPVTVMEQSQLQGSRGRSGNLNWTAELSVAEGATLWSSAWIFLNDHRMDGTTEYAISDEGAGLRERYDRTNDRRLDRGSYNFGLGFKQVFEPRERELTVDARFADTGTENRTWNERYFHVMAGEPADLPPELTLNDVDGGTGNLSLQVDYFRPLLGGRLDLGYRGHRRDQDDDNLLRVFDEVEAEGPREETRSGYDYRELFHALYGTYGRTHGRFGYQFGLRGERSSTRFQSRVAETGFDQSYNTLYPSGNLSFTPEPGRTLRLLYSRRIRRPSPFFLDAWVPSVDPLERSIGNPDLRPSFTHSFTLDYSHTTGFGTVRVAPFLRRTTDIWERIRTVDAEGVATSQWQNAALSRSWGSNLTVSLRGSGRLSGSKNLSVYRDKRDGTNLPGNYQGKAWLWQLGGNLGYRIAEGLTAQLMAFHMPSQSVLQGTSSGYTHTALAVRQDIMEGRGRVTLNVMDPLNLLRQRSTTTDATHFQVSRWSASFRAVTLGFTLNFGQTPERQSRPISSPDEGEGAAIPVPSGG